MLERVHVETLVVGAGVIGLACARALALSGRDVWVLERHNAIGCETSSRNSEVIHAGIYYPAGSLKAKLCVEGKSLLYDYLEARNLPYRRCGKLIVATNNDQLTELESIRAKASANGVDDLRLLSSQDVERLEPELQSVGALMSPSTGIFDSHAYLSSLQVEAESAGAQFLMKQTVKKLQFADAGIVIVVQEENGACYEVAAKEVVSAAGLGGYQWLAESDSYPKSALKPLYYAKGNYFSLQAKNPFSRLIYPVPERGGLGVHLTMDMSGSVRFGPDVEWVTALEYQVNEKRSDKFYDAIRSYWPKLPDQSLVPDYSGIRPKLTDAGGGVADFCIQTEHDHGIPGLINLTGIESPGLTASLAIANEVIGCLV